MGKRACVLLLALLLLLTGCSTAAPVKEDTAETAPAVENSAEIPASTEPEKVPPSLLPGQVDIVTADEDKPVREKQPIDRHGGMPEVYQEYAREMQDNNADFGEDISDKIYVYSEETLTSILWPAEDAVMNGETGETRLSSVASQIPTEAVRWIDDHYFYTIHDSDTHLRVFSFYYDFGDDTGYFERAGYPIYMSQTLSYSDFADIKVGTSAEEVEAIDARIMPFYLGTEYKTDLVVQKQLFAWQEQGHVFFSLHLLQDGLLKIIYEFDGTMFYVSDICFSEDFMLNSYRNVFSGERMDFCYAIDPIDYVINSSAE